MRGTMKFLLTKQEIETELHKREKQQLLDHLMDNPDLRKTYIRMLVRQDAKLHKENIEMQEKILGRRLDTTYREGELDA